MLLDECLKRVALRVDDVHAGLDRRRLARV